MADKNDGADKTEQPTPKRLKDARKQGDVAKSRELTSTAVLLAWLVIGAVATGHVTEGFAGLFDHLFARVSAGWGARGFIGIAHEVGREWLDWLLLLTGCLLLPAAAIGLLVEFLQAGPVLAFDKLKPRLEHLNPAEGLKRMFSLDNLAELVKALLKASLLAVIGWLVVRGAVPELVALAQDRDPALRAFGSTTWALTVRLLAWTLGTFALIALLDALWQRHRYLRKLRMSLRDIRQEFKDNEGDPMVKQQRRQAYQEWSQRNSSSAARQASVLVVNPTHVAIAIDYDRECQPVPVVSAKGEDHVARAMREAAEEAGVPILRNVPLARDMLGRAEVGEIVPPDLFDIVAEVLLWAREAREQLAHEAACVEAVSRGTFAPDAPPRRMRAPGEDLTRYAHDDDPLRGADAGTPRGA